MWLVEAITSGFTNEIPTAPLEVFRVLFGLSCLVKFTIETVRGHFRYFQPPSYLYFFYRLLHKRSYLTEGVYKVGYVLKIVAALLLSVDIYAHVSLLALTVWFLIELKVYFKYHVNLMLLFSILLLISLGHGSGTTIAHCLIVLTMSMVYIATAIRKMNPVFLSGRVVYITLRSTLHTRGQRQYFDFWFPKWFRDYFIDAPEEELRARWRPLMWGTVMLELLLPIALLNESTCALAIILGVIMHGTFLLLFPATLGHFSLLSISTYVLFLEPTYATTLIHRL